MSQFHHTACNRDRRCFAAIVPHFDFKRVRDHADYKRLNVANRNVDCDVNAIVAHYSKFIQLSRELDMQRAGKCVQVPYIYVKKLQLHSNGLYFATFSQSESC